MDAPRRTILITGACGDIGRALARAFANRDASLALCDLVQEAAAQPLLAELGLQGAQTLYRAVDVTDAAAMRAFVEETVNRFSTLDVCIVNAGIVERGAIVDLPVDVWRRTLEVNLTGGFITAQAAARAMLRTGRGGQIVFISSWVQDVPRENIGAYNASKGGLKMLARTLALELGPRGVRVNLVAPGWVDAGLTGKNLAAQPARRAEIQRQIPLGRLASADEVARAVKMLCGSDAAYVTGATLLLDGGSSLGFHA